MTSLQKVKDAVENFLSFTDAFKVEKRRWSEEDINNVRSCTGLSFNQEIEEVLKNYGYIERESELYFTAEFKDSSTEIAEVQMLFSKPERVMKDYSNINSEVDFPGRGLKAYLPFGTADGGRSFLLVDGNNRENTEIYYWPLAFDPVGEGDNARGIAKVSSPLAEFLSNLRTADDL